MMPLSRPSSLGPLPSTLVLVFAGLLSACGGEVPSWGSPQLAAEDRPSGTESGATESGFGAEDPAAADRSGAPGAAGAQARLDPPPDIPDSWRPLIGEYARGADTVSIMEDGGELKYLRWNGERSAASLVDDTLLRVTGMDRPVILRRPAEPGGSVNAQGDRASASPTALVSEGRILERLSYGVEEGATFRIDPVRPVEELRAEALRASPPEEDGEFRPPELVELVELDPTILLDVRYATTDNFMGARFYTEPRAFLQRPAAEALVRAHRWLNTQGYGLLVFDGYRPWYVTKMFWDATPDALKIFVANPAGGSRHNRGGAVDLTLYDLETGEPVDMPGGYDEFSPRSHAAYPGGTMRQRWFRSLLRLAMEAEGFAVYEAEWWHFDHEDWPRYRLGNQRFEDLLDA